MNTDLMFSSATDMWATPPELYAALDEEFGFTLDACAVRDNAKCPDYYTPEQDGWHNPGRAAYGAIRPMGGMSGTGSKRRRKRLRGGDLL